MVTGTVIRVGQVNMFESRRAYQCDKCHHQSVVKVTDFIGLGYMYNVTMTTGRS